MEQSRFASAFNFVGKTIQSGTKVQGSMHPTLIVASTKDKFVLNEKARGLMGVGEGDNVVLIDYNKGEKVTDNVNERYYITKGWDKGKGVIEGAKLGKGGSFSYAGIYSAMQMNDPNVSEASIKDMEKAGKGIIRKSKDDSDVFIATQKVTFKVVRLQSEDKDGNIITEFPVAAGILQPVFALTEMEIVNHEPRELSASGDAEVDANDDTEA